MTWMQVLLLDMGYAHFTATVAAFTNTSLKIVASVSDPLVGGRELDDVIARVRKMRLHVSHVVNQLSCSPLLRISRPRLDWTPGATARSA
jgi:hypothetical protein